MTNQPPLTSEQLTTLLETVEGRNVNGHYDKKGSYVGCYIFISTAERDTLCAAVRQLLAERCAFGLVYCPECAALREQLASVKDDNATAVANFRDRAVLIFQQRAERWSGEDTEQLQRVRSATYRDCATTIAALEVDGETGETR